MRKLLKIKGSYIIAIVIVVILGAWISTGEIVVGGQQQTDATAQADAPEKPAGDAAAAAFRVAVKTFTAEARESTLTVRGRTEARQRVMAKAETAGRIVELPAAKGTSVKTGDAICRLDAGAREARVLQAKAKVAQAELDFEAAEKLSSKGYASETRLRAAKAGLDAAAAALEEAELDLARTNIRAPFDGVIEAENAEIGDYLNVAAPCVTVISLDPLMAVGQVSERDVAAVKPGMPGMVTLVTGERTQGRVSFVSPASDPATRTFRLELELDNPGGALRDGVTARIDIPLQSTVAHRLPPAILSLDDTGNVGVKLVGEDAIARFHKVTIIGDDGGFVWVLGLPESVRIIVTGQDYVGDGEKVLPVEAGGGAA